MLPNLFGRSDERSTNPLLASKALSNRLLSSSARAKSIAHCRLSKTNLERQFVSIRDGHARSHREKLSILAGASIAYCWSPSERVDLIATLKPNVSLSPLPAFRHNFAKKRKKSSPAHISASPFFRSTLDLCLPTSFKHPSPVPETPSRHGSGFVSPAAPAGPCDPPSFLSP